MYKRFKIAMCNENAAGILEAVVLISIFIIICGFLMAFLLSVVELGATRSAISTGTGWFRTKDTTGIAD